MKDNMQLTEKLTKGVIAPATSDAKKADNGDKNEVLFCGTIVNKYESEKITMITLGITTQEGYRSHANYPKICLFDEDVRSKAEAFELHDKVVIKAYVSSQKEHKDTDNNFPPQTFVAYDILPAKNLINENADKKVVADQNDIYIVGQVYRAYVGRGGNVNLIIVSFREKKYMKKIRVSIFPKKGDNPIVYMTPGTRVSVKGYCRTTRKEMPDGEKKYFENIMATSIEKVSDN